MYFFLNWGCPETRASGFLTSSAVTTLIPLAPSLLPLSVEEKVVAFQGN